MDAAERNRIISNDYADLLIDYSNDADMDIVNALTDASINRIDRNYAVVHIPVASMTPNSNLIIHQFHPALD